MSVKIYEGLRSTISDPFEAGIAARKVMEPIFFDKIDEIIQRINDDPAVSVKEKMHLDFNPEAVRKSKGYSKGDDIALAFTIMETLKESSTWTFTGFDVMYDLVIMPNGITGFPPLAQIFVNDNIYLKPLLESGVFEDHGYWDNTDPEEDADWDERRQEWSRLIDEKHTPASLGLTVSSPGSISYRLHKFHQGG